jgi:hypothetical protein
MQSDAIFVDFANSFGIMDASLTFIQRLQSNQKDYYSGKYKAHCVKIRALVTADDECVHLSRVYYGSYHNKTTVYDSHIVRFLTISTDDGPERKVNLADVSCVEIKRTIPETIPSCKRLPHQDVSPEPVEFNRILRRNCILIENFFGHWKMLFRIIHGKCKGA